MSPIDYVAGWITGLTLASAEGELEFETGPIDRLNPSCWVKFETDTKVGQMTIWESGEMEVEVLSIPNGEPRWVESGLLDARDDFASLLARFLVESRSDSSR